MNRRILSLLVLVFLGVGFVGCNDEEPEKSLNVLTNEWIYDRMDEVYFWTDEMPSDLSTNQDPTSYFNSLLYSGDRFSAIVPNYEDLINSLNGVELEAGYEFALVQTGDNGVAAIVTYIKKGSPAADTDLQRGDLITEINGKAMTTSNYQSVIAETSSDHTISFARYNEGDDTFVSQPDISLSAVQFGENPIFLDSVYNVDSRKIGYLVYNFFSNGSTGDNFNDKLSHVFSDFKSEGITDLVVDLRYNSGGSIVSATTLASHMAPAVTGNDVFYRNQWNDLYEEYWKNQPDGDTQLTGYFIETENSVGNSISSNVYILTGSRTASASELIINGLDPYMNVTIIGRTTIGKNVGSIPIQDTDNPDNEYGILPIVIRLANSDGYSDYSNGFTPLGENAINEFDTPLKPLGDVEDPLLARAIELISGSSMGGRKHRMAKFDFEQVGSSLDRHLRFNKAILDFKK